MIVSFLIAATYFLLFASFQKGVFGQACSCVDKPTPDFSCQEQASWGKCDEDWIVELGYCKATCGRCKCDEKQQQQSKPKPPQKTDTSQKDKQSATPKKGGTEKNKQPATQKIPECSNKCSDIEPPQSEYNCSDYAGWNQCDEEWMAGYCLRSCGVCIQCPQKSSKPVKIPDNLKPPLKKEKEDKKLATTQKIPECSKNCVDIEPPQSEFNCSDFVGWGQCDEEWMTGYCLLSCGVCTQCPLDTKEPVKGAKIPAKLDDVIVERKANTDYLSQEVQEIDEVAVIDASATRVRQPFENGELAQDYAPNADKAASLTPPVNLGVGGFEIILERASSDSQASIERQFLLDEFPQPGCTPLEFQLSQMPDLQLFVTMLYRSGLMERLTSGKEDLTVFIPTNFAIDSFYRQKNLNPQIKNMKSNMTMNLLEYHIVGHTINHMDLIQQRQNRVQTQFNEEEVVIETVTEYVPNNFLCRGKYCDDQGNKVSAVSVTDAKDNKVQIIASLFNACKVTVHIVNSVLIPSGLKLKST